MWTERVVTFKPVNGKVTELPEHVVDDFSNDQKLAYFYARGVQAGKLPDDVARKVSNAQMMIQYFNFLISPCPGYWSTGDSALGDWSCQTAVPLHQVKVQAHTESDETGWCGAQLLPPWMVHVPEAAPHSGRVPQLLLPHLPST